MSRSKSILLQVAFKEAAADRRAQPDSLDVEKQTAGYYQLLLSLHDELGIAITDGPARSSSGGGSYPRKSNSGGSTITDEGVGFMLDGTIWRDFRTAKVEGRVKAGFPDFKSVDNESIWMIDREGNAVPEAAALVVAADAGAPF